MNTIIVEKNCELRSMGFLPLQNTLRGEDCLSGLRSLMAIMKTHHERFGGSRSLIAVMKTRY